MVASIRHPFIFLVKCFDFGSELRRGEGLGLPGHVRVDRGEERTDALGNRRPIVRRQLAHRRPGYLSLPSSTHV